MKCPESTIWKDYLLGETPRGDRSALEQHLGSCAGCRQEVEAVKATLAILRAVPEQEPPRRIAFVSDPVFAPSWWQRLLSSGPRLAFASAAMLSVAIIAHGMLARDAQPPAAPMVAGQVRQLVDEEVARRLPAAVDERVRAELAPAVAELRARLDSLETTRLAGLEHQRRQDLKSVESAFDYLERRLNTMVVNNARYGGD
jgi:anti-sigma factor RsiW